MDTINEIKKLKTLLDQGAIDKDEFQKLKNELILNNNTSSSGSSTRKEKHQSKFRRKGLLFFIFSFLVISLLVVVYLKLFENPSKLNFKILSNHKENINTNNIDSLKIFDNIIYDKGKIAGNLKTIEFVKNSNQRGHVFSIPNEKIWTSLFFEYEDLGKNYNISIPEILTEQNKNKSVGIDYYYKNIYNDKATGTWWENKSGFYFPEIEDFKSIKLSTRNNKALSGKNAIYVSGYAEDVKFKFYFFEEPIR